MEQCPTCRADVALEIPLGVTREHMFAIEAMNPKCRRWIAGIFEEHLSVETFLSAIPAGTGNDFKLIQLADISYPFFIVENGGFEYGSLALVEERLRELVPKEDEDFVHMSVYGIREDFVPEIPGIDSMGALFHRHITDGTLGDPRSRVFAQELAEFAGDA